MTKKHSAAQGKVYQQHPTLTRTLDHELLKPSKAEQEILTQYKSRSELSGVAAVERENDLLRRKLAEREHEIIVLKQLLLYR